MELGKKANSTDRLERKSVGKIDSSKEVITSIRKRKNMLGPEDLRGIPTPLEAPSDYFVGETRIVKFESIVCAQESLTNGVFGVLITLGIAGVVSAVKTRVDGEEEGRRFFTEYKVWLKQQRERVVWLTKPS